MIPFFRPSLERADYRAATKVLKSGWLGSGPQVAAFEAAFAASIGTSHAVAVTSCTSALHLSLKALGIGPGDEVITTPLTFCATINAILHSGARPILADVDPRTGNLSPSRVAAAITERTKAIIPVHYAGRPCEMEVLCEIARQNNVQIIEDCAHALEAKRRSRRCGTFGITGCFSFYPTKSITTGDGGMIVTSDDEIARKLKMLCNHGLSSSIWNRRVQRSWEYEVLTPGFKAGMNDLQASLGLSQLPRVDQNWRRRKQIWEEYQTLLADSPIGRPAKADCDDTLAYHLYTIRVDQQITGRSRAEIIRALMSRGIEARVHYLPITEHRFYRETFGWETDQYPESTAIGEQTISLPLYPSLQHKAVKLIGSTICVLLKK